MNEETESVDSGTPGVCLDVVPNPAARYAVRGEDIVLTAVNEQFRSLSTVGELGTSLRTWWEQNDVRIRGRPGSEVWDALSTGETVHKLVSVGATDATTHRFRATADAGTTTTGTIAVIPDREPPDTTLKGEQIASVVSHDLRNPLDVAKARARAARETGAGEHFDRLQQAHDRMERIIEDVLTLARGDEIIDPPSPVDLSTVVTDAWATVETGTATLECAADLPRVEADPDRLQRLFENLLRNSIEHGMPDTTTRPGTAKTANQASSGEMAADADSDSVTVQIGTSPSGFFVADDGPGISPDNHERIFEPGYAGDNGGTGLGLTIVEQIATAHGWDVTVTESDSGGVRFEFTTNDIDTPEHRV